MHWGRERIRVATLGLLLPLVLRLAACGGDDESSPGAGTSSSTPAESAAAPAVQLAGVKSFSASTPTGSPASRRSSTGSRRATTSSPRPRTSISRRSGARADEVEPLLAQMKAAWVEGNPYYERVEGIVAGTPSLAEYDVILDAGSSAAEDPESAVPFDLTLPDGTVLEQPGNLFNLTEGALWGTLPERARPRRERPPTSTAMGARVRRGPARSRPAPGGERERSTSTRQSSTPPARPGSRPPRMRSRPSS